MASGIGLGCGDPRCPMCSVSQNRQVRRTPEGWETREMITLDEAQRRFNVPRDFWKKQAMDELYNMQLDKYAMRSWMGSMGDNKLTKERNTPVKLSVMQKLLMAKDDQTLTKAGFLDGDMDLTEAGQEALDSILFAANKAALVTLAQANLDEEAAEAKK